MKTARRHPKRFREYPHMITQDVGRNVRWPVHVHATGGNGLVDAKSGETTAAGRLFILAAMSNGARRSKASICLVWSRDSCTFLMSDGTTIEGRDPPVGDPVQPSDYEHVNGSIVNAKAIKLPDGSAWPFICLRRLGPDHVEISSAEPLVLGHFDELPSEGPGSELRRHLDERGELVAPAVFRGVATTGIANGFELLGPVQPNGYVTRVVAPWPADIFSACREIAERDLPVELLQAVWETIDRAEPTITYTTPTTWLTTDCLANAS